MMSSYCIQILFQSMEIDEIILVSIVYLQCI
jgi:hypothetical protein